MADTSDKAVNGNYGTHQQYGHTDSYQAAQMPTPAPGNASFGEQPNTMSSAPGAGSTVDEKVIPKEEIGWYFVEQYYNTMSKEPGKLFLYYTKRSQFVSGNEAEKVPVAVGQRSISERIKELDIQDCKVRISNVDTQESFKNILVQVIGEMSNKAAPHRKFVQTFVLAEQPTGYYVLNDIFRYIIEEEEVELENGEAPQEATEPSQAPQPAPATLTSSNEPAEQKRDAELVDKKLEEKVIHKASSFEDPHADAASADDVAESEYVKINHAEDAPAAAVASAEEERGPDQAEQALAAEDEAQPEKPRDPDPTPVASPPKPVQAAPVQNQTPAAPPKPAAPKTWANLVASKNAAPPPTANGTKSASPVTTAQPKPKSAPPTKESPTPTAKAADEGAPPPQQNGNGGWQMAGADSNKRQGRQHSQSVSSNQENVLGYVKNVTDKVDASILKATLATFGHLAYFDVSRPKNCAFVEFDTPAAYNAAVADNPHSIGGEQIFVEERRPRANAYGGNFNGRGGMRGGRAANDNRPGSQGRGGFPKDGGRGGFGPRGGRGGAIASRSRGGQLQPA